MTAPTTPSILQLISSAGLYGAEKVLLELAAFWRDLGWSSHVGVFRGRGGEPVEVAEEARRRGLTTVTIAARGQFNTRALDSIRAYVAAHHIDLVHTHGYKTDVTVALACLPPAVRKVATCHTWYSRTPKLMLYELLDKIVLHHFDHVVVVAPQLAAELAAVGIGGERCTLIENGLAPVPTLTLEAAAGVRATLGVAPAERLLLRVGRLDAYKGNDVLLRAVAALRRDDPRLRLLLAGDGEDRAPLEALTAELGLGTSVIFAGYRRDVPQLLAACDVFVISSPKEGLPMVLLEAMSARRPIVTTAVGAIPGVIVDGETGLLVPPDDPTALAAALRRALHDPDAARAMADRAAARFAARHSQRAMGEKYRTLFTALLARTV